MIPPEYINPLKDITSALQEGRCILVLGPDIIDFGGKTFFESLCDDLSASQEYQRIVDKAPPHVFKSEELFQPVSEMYAEDLQNMIQRFYGRQTALDLPLTQITGIPFKLIISLMPDDRLARQFTRQNIDFSTGYYPAEGASAPPVEKPVKEKPLIYNLLGDFNHAQSIITFDDLFHFLSDIMGKKELPVEIQVALKEAGMVLFLGVNFEKWYAQLLLRIFVPKGERKSKYTLQRDGNDVYTFLARRFNLKLFPIKPKEFLDLLYEECVRLELLRVARPKARARVFISYSRKDLEIVEKIEERLSAARIEVIRDKTSMQGGQEIVDFINTIGDVDCVLSVVSEHSLLSRWVSIETITTLQNPDKYFLPCSLDQFFLSKDFMEAGTALADSRIKELAQVISSRIESDLSYTDLSTQLSTWRSYKASIPQIIDVLNSRNVLSLDHENFEENIPKVIDDILKNKKNA